MSAGGSVRDDAKATRGLWQGLCGDFRGCFTRPGGNRRKRHAFILDVRRWLWRFRADFSHFMLALEKVPESPPAARKPRKGRLRAA